MDWIENLARKHGTGGWQTLDDMVQFGKAVAEEVRRRVGIGGELIAATAEKGTKK